jgi:hypothetical protein
MYTAYPAHHIFLDFIVLIIFGETLLIMHSFQPPAISSFSFQNILLSAVLEYLLS